MIESQKDALKFIGPKVFDLKKFSDSRGFFMEWFKSVDFYNATGRTIDFLQANFSSSRKGVIRGIHFAKYPPGQAKFVTCLKGKVFDVIVDLRKNSPTFGKWDSVILDAAEPKSIFIPSGFGHGFMSLEDDSFFVYLCDQAYNPKNEFEINPFDPTLRIQWPSGIEPILSEKDLGGNTFLSMLDYFSEI